MVFGWNGGACKGGREEREGAGRRRGDGLVFVQFRLEDLTVVVHGHVLGRCRRFVVRNVFGVGGGACGDGGVNVPGREDRGHVCDGFGLGVCV